MIIPGQKLRSMGVIEPFHERTVENGMSYGVGPAGYDVRIKDEVRLEPGEFSLASTLERFNIPDDVVGWVCHKSTWARRGLDVWGGTILEPGWTGWLTLELANHCASPITILAGSPIAQIIFHRMEEPAQNPYRGKYQHQANEPVPAIEERKNVE